jgi:hypothetical protein
VRAVVQKNVVLSGAEAACVNCHRRSGLGGSEGQNPIRPIVGRLLFTASQTEFARRRAVAGGAAEARPAYTRASLARALREGVDPGGRRLDALMPRYALGDDEIDQLYAYLAGLSAAAAPGVSDREIHFATIIAPGVDAERRRAQLDVLQAFFRDKNGNTRKEARRRDAGSEQMYLAYRTWVLHVWELDGAPETWHDQLAAHYREQPVFAVIGGLGSGSWQPVHAFCEGTGVPCVLPDVDYPVAAGAGYYALYFSRGIALEADVLAKLERIEQMTQTALSPSVYPHLSLGPGQRFASKGGYVVGFPAGAGGAPVAVSDWLIAEPALPASLAIQQHDL